MTKYLNDNGMQQVADKIKERAKLLVTDIDPGEGVPLDNDTILAVYGTSDKVTTEDVEDNAITSSKIAFDTLLDKIYPVGSIYMSATFSTTTQVHDAIGGTWEAWGAGRVPVGVDTGDTDFNTSEKTSGEKRHTLTTSEIPSHNHVGIKWGSSSGKEWSDPGSARQGYPLGVSAGNIASGSWCTGNAGGGGSHNNLQPYITCYMYKRIS